MCSLEGHSFQDAKFGCSLARTSIPCENRFAMKLTINGQQQDSAPSTLAQLIEHLGMKQDRVAVELNRNIVPRDQWAATNLT